MEHMKTTSPMALALLLTGAICALAQPDNSLAWQVEPPPPHMRLGPGGERPGPPAHRQERRGGPLAEGGPLEAWLQYIQERDPEQFEELQRLRREDPGELRRRMREHRRALQRQRAGLPPELPETREIREMERTARMLARQVRQDEAEPGSEIEEELRETLGRIFDLREARRARHLREMEERMERLRILMETRQANREAIIEHRLREIIMRDEIED